MGIFKRLLGGEPPAQRTSSLWGRDITTQEDFEGQCDICSIEMPPSGGIVTADGMKVLVQSGFNPFSNPGPVTEKLLQLHEKEGVPRSKAIEHLLRRILNKEMGGFALCPRCFNSVRAHMDRAEG